MSKKNVIAIDGSSASGKSTITKILAHRLNFYYINTGKMYRILTLKIIEDNPDWLLFFNFDDSFYSKQITSISMDFNLHNKEIVPSINNNYNGLNSKIYSENVSKSVSIISKNKKIRNFMVAKQRLLSEKFDNIILEGRDIGTCVFPNANYKFYLTALLKTRINRRVNQIIKNNKLLNYDAIYKSIEEDIKNRDEIDSTRNISPLKPAKDAIIIKCDDLNKEDIVNIIINKINISY